MIKSTVSAPDRLPEYVYRMIRQYGNTVISNKIYCRYGERRILEMLRQEGLDCHIYKTTHEIRDVTGAVSRRDIDIVVEEASRHGICHIKRKDADA